MPLLRKAQLKIKMKQAEPSSEEWFDCLIELMDINLHTTRKIISNNTIKHSYSYLDQ